MRAVASWRSISIGMGLKRRVILRAAWAIAISYSRARISLRAAAARGIRRLRPARRALYRDGHAAGASGNSMAPCGGRFSPDGGAAARDARKRGYAGPAGRCDRVRRMQSDAAGGSGCGARFLAEHPEFSIERPQMTQLARWLQSDGTLSTSPERAVSTAFSPPGCAGAERAFCRAAAEALVFANGTRA